MTKVLIVEARFYPEVADELLAGAMGALREGGVVCDRISVPGAFEIPAVIAMAVRAAKNRDNQGAYDGFLALGCVIRGETSHYDYVCAESARKLQDLACDHAVAVGYGILTCETMAQAQARADRDGHNKGGAVAEACLRMIEIRRGFGLADQ
ncbi:MAG: 6,7-dimethyl-8-ribityllumazine synthase [Pseudomonadota bacterium]